MNPEYIKLLAFLSALLLCFALGGCDKKSAEMPLEAELEFSMMDAEILTESEAAEEYSRAFANAYFGGDNETVQSMLHEPYEHEISIYDGVVPEEITVRGADAAAVVDEGAVFTVSVDALSGGECFAELRIDLIKTARGFETAFYCIES